MLDSGRQLRRAAWSGQVLGFELGAVLELGRAKGIAQAVLAEFLPGLEVAMIEAFAKTEGNDG